MERIIIYLLVLVNLSIGLILFYRKPRPFGRRTYEDYPAETHGAACGWAADRLRAETKNKPEEDRLRTETKNKPAEHDGHASLPY